MRGVEEVTVPWEVRRRGDQHCVVKIADGSVVACHASADKANAQLRALYASEAEAAVVALEAAREGDVNLPGASHNLRDYWVRGEGAAKIRWNTEGDGTRCIKHLRKYVRDPGGLCQEYHRLATGKSMHPHPGRLTEATEMKEFHGHHDERAHGNWAHPGKFLEKGEHVAEKASGEVANFVRHLRRSANKAPSETHAAIRMRQRLRDLDTGELHSVAKHLKVAPKDSHDATISAIVNHVLGRQSPADRSARRHGLDIAKGDYAMDFADTPAEPYGDVKYADPGYRGRKRYPIDTEKHIRAAWAYINMPKNAAKYSADQLKSIKAKIKKAMTGVVGADVAATADALLAFGAKGCPPGHHKMPDGSCMADDQMQTYADEGIGVDEPWEGVLTVEGAESGDGRVFSTGSLDWAELPMPLMYQPANTGGHSASVLVGEIRHASRRDGGVINGRGVVFGHALAGEHGDDIRQMIKTGGVSVDVDNVKDADVEMVYADGDAASAFGKPETTIYHRGRIRGATLVAFPAFVEAKLRFTSDAEDDDIDDEDDTLTASASCGCEDELLPFVAAAHTITIPDLPKASWFDEPTDVKLNGALTITDEGRVYGLVAPAGVRHRNVNTQVPRNLDFSRFHKGETIVEGGTRVITGVITADCGHAPTQGYGSLQARMDHYDNSCSVLANGRVGYRQDGSIWFAGALNPGAQPHQVAQALGCTLSLDVQPHPDRPGVREFIAAHLVPVPGFPMARQLASVTYEDGALTASSVPIRHEPTAELAAVARTKREIVERFGLDPASRKQRAYAKMRKVKATCALVDAPAPR